MFIRKFIAIFCCLSLLLFSSACKQKGVTATGFALNTVISVSLYDGDEALCTKMLTRAGQWEKIFSKKIEGSDVDKLNGSGGIPVTVTEGTAELLALAEEMHRLSDGLFDITVAPVSDLWDFNGEPRVPSEGEIQAALSSVGQEALTLSGNEATLKNGAQIDLGALAKGYIGDLLVKELKEAGKTRGIVNLGGNVSVFGGEEEPFTVAVQKPFGASGEYACTLSLAEGAVVTSGVYERGFEADGVWYHHLLNAKTGYPADNGLWSVTVITETGARGDALSTTLFLMGEQKGMALAEALPDTEAVFISSDGTVRYTSGLQNGTGRCRIIS